MRYRDEEIHEFRIFEKYYHLLPKNNAVFNGAAYVLKITRDDPLFMKIPEVDKRLKDDGHALYAYWNVKRLYSSDELSQAKLFHVKVKPVFEPIGEDCGTIYDKSFACDICGAHPKQITPLKLRKGSIPKKDIARTYVNEIVVSERFREIFVRRALKGIQFAPICYAKGISSSFLQPIAESKLNVSGRTLTGIDPFDLSDHSEGREFTTSGGYLVRFEPVVYKCPNGDSIGANLLSEVYVKDNSIISDFDYFETEQAIGGKQGSYHPNPILLCSPAFRTMVIEEKLKGFDFEVAHIVTE
jgi:hypothetical protein